MYRSGMPMQIENSFLKWNFQSSNSLISNSIQKQGFYFIESNKDKSRNARNTAQTKYLIYLISTAQYTENRYALHSLECQIIGAITILIEWYFI